MSAAATHVPGASRAAGGCLRYRGIRQQRRRVHVLPDASGPPPQTSGASRTVRGPSIEASPATGGCPEIVGAPPEYCQRHWCSPAAARRRVGGDPVVPRGDPDALSADTVDGPQAGSTDPSSGRHVLRPDAASKGRPAITARRPTADALRAGGGPDASGAGQPSPTLPPHSTPSAHAPRSTRAAGPSNIDGAPPRRRRQPKPSPSRGDPDASGIGAILKGPTRILRRYG